MRSQYQRQIILLAIFLTCALPALANAGTPLVWWGFFSLIGGNFLIAAIESAVAFQYVKRRHAIEINIFGWLLIANYASMGIGYLGLWYVFNRVQAYLLGSHPVANLPWLAAVVFLSAFCITVAIEWLFVYFGVKRGTQLDFVLPDPPTLRRITWRANLLAQLASYALLVPLYLLASGTTLLTRVDRERTLDFVKTPQAEVYYRPVNGTGLYRIRLDGSQPKPANMSEDELLERVTHYYADYSPKKVMYGGLHEKAVDLRPLDRRQLEVSTGFWAIEGLSVRDTAGKTTYRIAMEMPFFFWPSRQATVLPGDQVVYQINDSLVLFDLHSRKIADLGPGRNPVVFIPGLKYPGRE